MYSEKNISISSWAEEDQPRQKLISYGKNSLSDTELLAIIIGSGTVKRSAVNVAQTLLDHYSNNIGNMSRLRVSELCKFPGIGPAKAANIIAAIEMGRRVSTAEPETPKLVSSSNDAYSQLKDKFYGLEHEEFWILLMNRRNAVIKTERISVGGLSATMVDPKIIFSRALENFASSLILAHNHPSGNLEASMSDIELTSKLQKGAKILDISILDHLIITDQSFMSFRDEGML